MNCEHLNEVGSEFRVQKFMGSSLPYKIHKTMNCEHLNKVGSGFRVQGSRFRSSRFRSSGFRSSWVQVNFTRFVKL
ncbi:hypothetical protein, partial [Cecembia sp.]|uniref:hypothetical protein n=1 Tax=Cecembia sp. TaxID=1898110 RepID=UPI0025BC02F7